MANMNKETVMACLCILENELLCEPTMAQVSELYKVVMEHVREQNVPCGTSECADDERRKRETA